MAPPFLTCCVHRLPAFITPEHRASGSALGSGGVDDASGHPSFGSEVDGEICAEGEGEMGLTKEQDTAAVKSLELNEHEEETLVWSMLSNDSKETGNIPALRSMQKPICGFRLINL